MLGEGQLDLIVQWGRRRKGVTAPEVAEHFGIPHYAAWRVIRRLVERGRLKQMDRKRSRDILFNRPGRGADVYKTPERIVEDDEVGQAGWS